MWTLGWRGGIGPPHEANGGNSLAPRPEERYPAPSRIRTWWSLYPLRLQGARVYPPHVIRLAAPVLSGPATPKTCSTARGTITP